MKDTREPPACSCWMLPGPDGVDIAAGALHHLLTVDVTTRDGATYRGEAVGTCWAGLPGTRQRHLLLVAEDGEYHALAESRLSLVAPAGDEVQSERAETALRELAEAIRAAQVPWEVVSVAAPIDEARGVRATVWLIDHYCEPGPDPRKASRS